MNKENIKAIIFDMDGVIFDSEKLVIDCWKVISEKYKIQNIEAALRKCIGTTREVTRQIIKEEYGQDFPYDEYKNEVSLLFKKTAEEGNLMLKPGIVEILTYFKNNNYKIAIASSTRKEIVEKELKQANLYHYFDKVICGDMVQRSKPEPDIFLKACEELNVDTKDALVIEDSYNGIRAAYTGKISCVMIPDLLPPNTEMEEKADYIFDNLSLLQKFFENEN